MMQERRRERRGPAEQGAAPLAAPAPTPPAQ
jgi:hypothetical protein